MSKEPNRTEESYIMPPLLLIKENTKNTYTILSAQSYLQSKLKENRIKASLNTSGAKQNSDSGS